MIKGKETKAKLIKTAEYLFLDKKVEKVTINDIVTKAGVAKGTFYLYFESKDALVWRLMDNKVIDLNRFIERQLKTILVKLLKQSWIRPLNNIRRFK